MGTLVLDVCMHVVFLLSVYLLPWIPGIIQGLLMSISPITTFLLWIQNKQQKSGCEVKCRKNVERLILKVGNGNLGGICEGKPLVDSEFESEEDKEERKVVDMVGYAIPERENVVEVCEKAEASGEDLHRLEMGEVTVRAKEHNVRLLIAEFEKRLGSVRWNYNGKSKDSLLTLSDKFVCSSENNYTSTEETESLRISANMQTPVQMVNDPESKVDLLELDKLTDPLKTCSMGDDNE